ncbi:hypothetical protein AD006_01140 [Pseudonocardia sp. EC080610-09]|uniref:HK97 family phage prohead protease n=1 Tax=unclassified Pseudonocardia TaxID=2619320 RepID=UPI00070673F5|nr:MULTISPECIES: HK97 family phage prohead protease [unclassified Pseudonocardia]ALL74272.1 hypothetical protein AD006_01140 [Pseudonocardia sp. EC080610-09]ALL81295.1 hypothetical protein AD017_08965 [Pseudonocardia sp. EC080619-01]
MTELLPGTSKPAKDSGSSLLIRSAASADDVDINESKREVEGLAVPYGIDQFISQDLTERFERGAFAKQLSAAHRTFFTRKHITQGGSVIGKAVELRESAEGLVGKWKISETLIGDETLTLLRDGVLTGLSIGFRARQNRRDKGVTVRTSATLVETAVVEEPAYGDLSVVTDVREIYELTNSEKAAQILASIPALPSRT